MAVISILIIAFFVLFFIIFSRALRKHENSYIQFKDDEEQMKALKERRKKHKK